MQELFVKDDIDFDKWMKESEHIVQVKEPSHWSDGLAKLVKGGNQLQGAKLPWSKTHDLIRFDKAQVSIWAGINGHGKSLVLGMAVMHFASMGEPVCIASLEMAPEKTLFRQLKQAAMTGTPSLKAMSHFVEWANKKMWVYDKLGHVKQDKLFAVIRYSAVDLGVKHFVIDNMGLCVRRADDYNEQKDFITDCMVLAEELGIHIHIVHHIKKLEDELKCPGKFDIKGGGEIVDYVHNALIVYRNKRKENDMAEARRSGKGVEAIEAFPDAMLNIVKSRDSGWEGKITLWYDHASGQYRAAPPLKHLDIIGMGKHTLGEQN